MFQHVYSLGERGDLILCLYGAFSFTDYKIDFLS